MDKSGLIDKALEMLAGDMDELEGKDAMAHSLDDCPDPLSCKEHDGEVGEPLADDKAEDKGDAALTIEIKPGMPTMEGKSASEEGGDLSDEDAEELAKLLK